MRPPSSSAGCRRARRSVPLLPAPCAALLATLLVACKPAPPRPPEAPQPDRVVTLEGSIHLGNGQELAYRAILVRDPAAPTRHIGTIDIPMQALSAASLEGVVFQPRSRIEFALALPGTPRWAGEVAADGSIACEFRQSDIRLPCSMQEVRATQQTAPILVGESPQPPAER